MSRPAPGWSLTLPDPWPHVPTEHPCTDCGHPLSRVPPSNMVVCDHPLCPADPKFLIPTEGEPRG